MPQITPDQFDDCLERAGVEVTKTDNKKANLGLYPSVALLNQLNELLAKDGGQAGTHAYDMMAAVEEINTGNARVLIELIAGVVMMKRNDNPLLDTMSVTFQPSDIDEMQRNYEFGVKRYGLHVTVTLVRKAEPTESWTFRDDDEVPAKPQAEAQPDRPVWAIRVSDMLTGYPDRATAEDMLLRMVPELGAQIENRYCLHPECPTTGCNHAEATSSA